MSGYFIGMDGGGSNTIVAIANDESILYEQSFPATNYHNVGIESVKTVLKIAIDKVTEEVGITWSDIEGICLGGAGVDTEEDEAIIKYAFKEIGYFGKLSVVNDAYTALIGANGKKEGAVLISGTGSIALGLKGDEMIRVGGWGHIIGDEGSGYSLSRDAFREVSKFADGRKSHTKLFEAMQLEFGFTKPEDMIGFLYSGQTGKDAVAKLAPRILALYEEDRIAKEIVDHNISELVQMIQALSQKMAQVDFNLALAGSVLTKSPLYYELFQTQLKDVLPAVKVFKGLEHPVNGAVYLARGL